LRLILTFKPETSFLVPLDRCIQLMKTILAAPPVPNLKGAEALVEHRRQALSFLRTCLASVLNLSSGTARAGAGEGDIKDALEGVVAGWFGKAETEGEEGGEGQSPTGGRPPGAAAQLGNKTKTQLMAEQAVFKQLLTTVVAAEAGPSAPLLHFSPPFTPEPFLSLKRGTTPHSVYVDVESGRVCGPGLWRTRR